MVHVDWLIDLYWVRALTVPMHLGLIDGPFVPHNLILAQESPVPLPKFQMAPRLKMLMSSGSNKGNQIYYFFLPKSPGKRIPSRFPNGDPMERDTSLQGIFTYLLIYLYISKALRKEHPSMFPKSGASMEKDAHSRFLRNIFFGVLSKGALTPGPPHGVPSERDAPFLEPFFICHLKSPVNEPLCPDSRFPLVVKGPLWRVMPVSGAFLNISSRVPSKGALPRGPRHWPLQRETLHSWSPLHPSLTVPDQWAPSRVFMCIYTECPTS